MHYCLFAAFASSYIEKKGVKLFKRLVLIHCGSRSRWGESEANCKDLANLHLASVKNDGEKTIYSL
jgi:hypothetical protein